MAETPILFDADPSPDVDYSKVDRDPVVSGAPPAGFVAKVLRIFGYVHFDHEEVSPSPSPWPKLYSFLRINPSASGWGSRTNLKIRTEVVPTNATSADPAIGGVGAIDVTTRHSGSGAVAYVGGINTYSYHNGPGSAQLVMPLDAQTNISNGHVAHARSLWLHPEQSGGQTGDESALILESHIHGGQVARRAMIRALPPTGNAQEVDRFIWSESPKPSLLSGPLHIAHQGVGLTLSRQDDGMTTPAIHLDASAPNANGIRIANDIAQNVPGVQATGPGDVPLILAAKQQGGVSVAAGNKGVGHWIQARQVTATLLTGHRVPILTAQLMQHNDIVAIDSVGGVKKLTSTEPVTVQMPSADSQTGGGILTIVNVGAHTITIAHMLQMRTYAGQDLVLPPDAVVQICSTGAPGFWYQVTPVLENS